MVCSSGEAPDELVGRLEAEGVTRPEEGGLIWLGRHGALFAFGENGIHMVWVHCGFLFRLVCSGGEGRGSTFIVPDRRESRTPCGTVGGVSPSPQNRTGGRFDATSRRGERFEGLTPSRSRFDIVAAQSRFSARSVHRHPLHALPRLSGGVEGTGNRLKGGSLPIRHRVMDVVGVFSHPRVAPCPSRAFSNPWRGVGYPRRPGSESGTDCHPMPIGLFPVSFHGSSQPRYMPGSGLSTRIHWHPWSGPILHRQCGFPLVASAVPFVPLNNPTKGEGRKGESQGTGELGEPLPVLAFRPAQNKMGMGGGKFGFLFRFSARPVVGLT